jgi:hypothetical protein
MSALTFSAILQKLQASGRLEVETSSKTSSSWAFECKEAANTDRSDAIIALDKISEEVEAAFGDQAAVKLDLSSNGPLRLVVNLSDGSEGNDCALMSLT